MKLTCLILQIPEAGKNNKLQEKMGKGKPRGLNSARKLRVHRRNKYVQLQKIALWLKDFHNKQKKGSAIATMK